MALRFIDSFDHYAVAQVGLKYTQHVNGNANSMFLTASTGRNGTVAMQTTHHLSYFQMGFDSRQEWFTGFAYKTSVNTDTNARLVRFFDGSTLHVELSLDATGKFTALRNGTVIATGSQVISNNVFYYLEVRALIDDSSGRFVLRINGATDIDFTGDTRNGGNASADTLRWGFGGNLSAGTQYWDDLYVCDTSGSAPNNTFLGDIRVEALLPSGNGNSSQLVGSDSNSTDNYLLVDESTPNSDTDYVESSTVNDKDTYAYGNLTSTTGTVYGVQVLPFARKTDAGTRSIKSVARLSGTEVDSADKALSTDYVYLPDIRETKPGGGAWSISDVNSAEFGVKVSA